MGEREQVISKLFRFFYNYNDEQIAKIEQNIGGMSEEEKDDLLQILVKEYHLFTENQKTLTNKLIELNNDFTTIQEQSEADKLLLNL